MPQTLDGTVMNYADYQARMLESIPASYVVWKDETQAKAECLLKGGTDYTTGTDATIIQNALDGLTAGRAWKEKVVLKGDYTIDTCISVPSYTIIEILGKVKLANNATLVTGKGMFNMLNKSHIEILGGIFDGNKAFNTGIVNPVVQMEDDSSDSVIAGVTVHDSPHIGIMVRNSSRVLVKDCASYNNAYDGISVQGGEGPSTDIIVDGNICYSNGRGGIHVDGIYTDTRCERVLLANNICHSQTGVTAVGAGFGVELSNHVSIVNCQSYNNKRVDTTAIGTGFGFTVVTGEQILISNCRAYNNDTDGIHVYSEVHDSLICDNIIYNNGQLVGATYRDGITLNGFVDYCVIASNRIKDHAAYEIRIVSADCDKNLIHGNILLGTHTGTISDSGTGTVKADNVES